LLYLQHFIDFLAYIRDKKNIMRFSHMEENLWAALHDTATLTELAVLALYAQAVTHPYMRVIRGSAKKKTNMLDLGPMHHKITAHMTKIIEDPCLLVGGNASYQAGAADGLEWNAPNVFQAIQNMVPKLPHLKPVLVEFFQGAQNTWKRFISEFAPGGLIDEATLAERELAWMPPTNDVNEGALGSFRVLMRRQPLLSLLQYNAQAMFHHNDTQAFIKQYSSPEDEQYIREKACQSNKEERMRKQAIVSHNEERIAKRTAAAKKRKDNATKRAERVAKIELIWVKDDIDKLKGQKLKDHLKAFQIAGAPNLQPQPGRDLTHVGPI
jgi:hypothetical protein